MISRLYIVLLLSCFSFSVINAQNSLIVHDVLGVSAGNVVLIEVEVENADEFTAFQFDIPLPAGFDYVEESISFAGRETDHELSGNLINEESALRIVSYSGSNATYGGTDGNIVTFELQAPLAEGTYDLIAENVILSSTEGDNILTGTQDGLVELILTSQYIITASSGEGGIIEPEGEIEIVHGANQTFEFTPDEGYQVDNVMVDGESVGNPPNYTFYDVNDNHDISVTFISLTGKNILSINSVTASPESSAVIEIVITNEDPFVAFQFDIPLPEGFVYEPGTVQLAGRETNHSIEASVLDGNILRVLSYSDNNEFFEGNDGVVATFQLQTSEKTGTFVLVPENALITDLEQNILTNIISGAVSVATLLPPRNLAGEIDDDGYIYLTWDPPFDENKSDEYHNNYEIKGSPELVGYNVYRNDEVLLTLDPETTTYLDDEGVLGESHYYVTALYTNPEGESERTDDVFSTGALPVILLEFDAECGQDEIDVWWTTAAEINNDYFLLERSINYDQWEYVTTTYGQGTTSVPMHYSITDNFYNDINSVYYRLTQYDFDGAETIYEPIVVNCSQDNGGLSLHNIHYDNNRLRVSFLSNSASDVTLEVYSLSGSPFLQSQIKGVCKHSINWLVELIDLPEGVYLISLSNRQEKVVRKFVR